MLLLQLMWHFALAVLATWRVTHLLAAEDGPGDIVVRFRARLGQSFAGRLMDCFYCLSLWIAAPAALFVTRQWLEGIMVWLAISGAACLLERLAPQTAGIQAGNQFSPGGNSSVLRTETNGDQEQPIQYEPEEFASLAGHAPDPNREIYGFRAPASSSRPGRNRD